MSMHNIASVRWLPVFTEIAIHKCLQSMSMSRDVTLKKDQQNHTESTKLRLNALAMVKLKLNLKIKPLIFDLLGYRHLPISDFSDHLPGLLLSGGWHGGNYDAACVGFRSNVTWT